jgi:hypothetical protein
VQRRDASSKNQIYAGPTLSTRSPTLTADTLRPSRAFLVKWVGTGATMGGERELTIASSPEGESPSPAHPELRGPGVDRR